MAHEPAGQTPTTIDRQSAGFSPPSPQELAARLPNLEVTELLGQGGMGVVYKGRQVFLDRPVAIKVIRPDFNSPDAQRNFIHEARSLAKLTHPYIVNVFDCGKVDDLFYFVMEYVEGQSLRHLIASKSVSARDVLDFLPQVGEALQFAHDAGIVHRDVKPENILVDPRNRVRLVDFGLAKWLAPGAPAETNEKTVAGTWGYIAPEQLSTPESVDHRSDIFSTGVVCYEMLTGRVPRAEFVPPSKLAAKSAAADPRFDPIVGRALERDRERRYQQMREMNTDVLSLTRTPESTLRMTKSIPAPVQRVFDAWTKPEVMADWYAPTDEYVPSTIEVDLRVGGRYEVGMKHKDKERHVVSGHYCRIEPPNLLSFTWAWQTHHSDTPETQVTIEMVPNGDSTDLTLFQERFRDEAFRDDHKHGWTGCLSRLAARVGH